MQYFKPQEPFFAGECMPFFHDGVFHLFYLLDENHHQGKGGLGGHQWAHALFFFSQCGPVICDEIAVRPLTR
jgi:hypothetical protein